MYILLITFFINKYFDRWAYSTAPAENDTNSRSLACPNIIGTYCLSINNVAYLVPCTSTQVLYQVHTKCGLVMYK